ncbi:hypothetical protein NUSPORA_00527 [Nucleospora cyclopteri]
MWATNIYQIISFVFANNNNLNETDVEDEYNKEIKNSIQSSIILTCVSNEDENDQIPTLTNDNIQQKTYIPFFITLEEQPKIEENMIYIHFSVLGAIRNTRGDITDNYRIICNFGKIKVYKGMDYICFNQKRLLQRAPKKFFTFENLKAAISIPEKEWSYFSLSVYNEIDPSETIKWSELYFYNKIEKSFKISETFQTNLINLITPR